MNVKVLFISCSLAGLASLGACRSKHHAATSAAITADSSVTVGRSVAATYSQADSASASSSMIADSITVIFTTDTSRAAQPLKITLYRPVINADRKSGRKLNTYITDSLSSHAAVARRTVAEAERTDSAPRRLWAFFTLAGAIIGALIYRLLRG